MLCRLTILILNKDEGDKQVQAVMMANNMWSPQKPIFWIGRRMLLYEMSMAIVVATDVGLDKP